jgi:hypothetical protein
MITNIVRSNPVAFLSALTEVQEAEHYSSCFFFQWNVCLCDVPYIIYVW